MKGDISVKILSSYMDERLRDGRREAVRRHIETCSNCKKALGLLTAYKAVVSSLPPINESVTFDIEFQGRLNEALAKKKEESVFEIAAVRIREGLETILLPKVPRLVRVAVSILLMVGITTYFYLGKLDMPIIVSMTGDVVFSDSRVISWREARLGTRVRSNILIAAKEGSTIDIEMPNKFGLRLKGDSRLKIAGLTPKFIKGTVNLELIKGRALVDIHKDFRPSRLIIKTPSAEARALGTKFAVTVTEKKKTWVGVLEGNVEVSSRPKGPRYVKAEEVIVKGGQMTQVSLGEAPLKPKRLAKDEWRELEELYQIGKKLQVLLLIKNTPTRVIEVLRPAPLYISDEKPREIPPLLESALVEINEAIKTGDEAKHLEAIHILERIVNEHPNPRYDPQLLLFTGAYYRYINCYEDAVRTLEKVIGGYPETTFASIAQCAVGIIYEEDLKNSKKAQEAYGKVLTNYPDSLEAIWLEAKARVGETASG